MGMEDLLVLCGVQDKTGARELKPCLGNNSLVAQRAPSSLELGFLPTSRVSP